MVQGSKRTLFSVLKRNGTYGENDLNAELTIPLARHIAKSWCELFQSDLFHAFDCATIEALKRVIDRVVRSVPPYLAARAKKQGEICLEQAHAALATSVVAVQRALDIEQKSISRCLAPQVQGVLKEGYRAASQVSGKGSSSRQKVGRLLLCCAAR